MARTRFGIVRLQPSTTTRRPEPGTTKYPGFSAGLGLIEATQIDEDSVILVPESYCLEPDDSEDASWRGDYETNRCWKATVVYEQIGENHPHIVPFKRRDPWTALPVLAKPSGPPVIDFINQHRSAMYSAPLDGPSSRILGSHRPLAYQWVLHIISGLTFVHSHDVIFGELDLTQCWLSSNLDLSLVGFINAGFRDRSRGYRLVEGDHSTGYGFAPPKTIRDPTKQTDLFWFGCTVFQLMTGAWPGHRLENGSEREAADMVVRREWLPLESECMGEIVHKCWGAGYNSAEEVQTAIMTFLQDKEWEVDGDDNLKGFLATDLFL